MDHLSNFLVSNRFFSTTKQARLHTYRIEQPLRSRRHHMQGRIDLVSVLTHVEHQPLIVCRRCHHLRPLHRRIEHITICRHSAIQDSIFFVTEGKNLNLVDTVTNKHLQRFRGEMIVELEGGRRRWFCVQQVRTLLA